MTKQEKIQEAYGKYFEEMEIWIDEEGWFNKNAFYQKEFSFNYEKIDILFSHLGDFMIPKSILGITNNNGWTKIENESNLPITNGLTKEFFFFTKSGHITTNTWNDTMINKRKEFPKIYTHYQQIIKPENPLY